MSQSARIAIRRLADIRDPAVSDYLDLYETAFPAQERIPVSSIVETLLAGPDEQEARLLVAEVTDSGKFAGMAHVVMFETAVYLLYIAAVEAMRCSGVGSVLVEHVLVMAHELGQPVILEVEDPATLDGQAAEMAERRIGFYRRHGFKLLGGIDYLQTVPFYPEGIPMSIMLHPGVSEMTGAEAFRLASELLGSGVRRGEGQLALC